MLVKRQSIKTEKITYGNITNVPAQVLVECTEGDYQDCIVIKTGSFVIILKHSRKITPFIVLAHELKGLFVKLDPKESLVISNRSDG